MAIKEQNSYAWMSDVELLSIMRGYGNKKFKNLNDLQLKIKWKGMTNQRRTRIIQIWNIQQERFDEGK
jgi:uncharacterized protein YehS (DUF1456 family)